MTLKISSCIKLIRADIKRRGWLTALSGGLFFLTLPVYTMLYLSTYTDRDADLVNYLPGLLNGQTLTYLAAALAAIAVLSALTGFGYIHSKEKLDFFHSLPVKRPVWFSVTYLAGLFIILVPYIICVILSVTVCFVNGVMNPELALRCAQAFIGGVLAVFIIYSACVFALMLTGRTVTGLLMSLAVTVYPLLTLSLVSALENTFFKSIYAETDTLLQNLAQYLSPAGLFSLLISRSAEGMLSFPILASTVFLSALFIAGAAILYRIYPSEAAGTAIAFPFLSPLIKVLICIPAAPFFSLMIYELMMLKDTAWLFPLSLISAIFLCAVIDFIYTMNLKLLIKSWKSSLISVAGIVLILCFFQFDLSGYDSYIPDENKIESISFCPDSFFIYFMYPESEYTSVSSLGYFAPGELNGTLYTLAQSGIANLEKGITPEALHSGEIEEDARYLSAVFQYRLKSGRTVTRQYALRYTDAEKAMKTLLENTEYRKIIFPFFRIDQNTVSSVSLFDIYMDEKVLDLDRKQREALLNAYVSDLLETDADTFLNQTPIGEFKVRFPNNSKTLQSSGTFQAAAPYPYGNSVIDAETQSELSMLYLYPEYTNTLTLLKDYGYTLPTEIDPEKISSIQLYISDTSSEKGHYRELISELSESAEVLTYDDSVSDTNITVTSPEDISVMLKYIGPNTNNILNDGSNAPDYVDIQYTNGNMWGYSTKI